MTIIDNIKNKIIDENPSVDPSDAELIIQMKDREIKGVSKNVVQKAFPELGL